MTYQISKVAERVIVFFYLCCFDGWFIPTFKDKNHDLSDEINVTLSTGNVFKDFGLPDSEELLIKSNLALKLNNIIEKRHLSQLQAAAILGIPQSKVSLLLNQSSGKILGLWNLN